MSTPIQIRRASTATLTANNPVLRAGEGLYEKDTGRLKIGDGQTAWNDLPYFDCGHGETPTPTSYRTMTAIIDENNSDPATCVSYTDDAASMTPGSDEWDAFFGHYPVMLLNGVEGKKLQRNNFAKHEDGTAADITTGAEGDVMICFPRRGLHMERDDANGHKRVIVSMTNKPNDSAFEYYAHSRGSTAKDKFYVGAYEGSNVSDKLCSLSGKTPWTNVGLSAFRTAAQAKGAPNGNGGSGYDVWSFYPLTFLQAMYVLKYQNLDSQTAVGRGVVSNSAAIATTGGTETNGMDWGETTGQKRMKLFGIEDFWGNLYNKVEGFFTNSNGALTTATENFNDAGTGYILRGPMSYGYIKSVCGTSEMGFAVKEGGGSASTYYSDYSYLGTGCGLLFCGDWRESSTPGAFFFNAHEGTTRALSNITARLMYL